MPEKKEIKTYPTKGITHFMYAEIYRSSGNITYANIEYKRALEYDTTATILNSIAESYLMLGKPLQATDYYEMTLKLEPDNEVANLSILDLYMKNMRYEEAIPILENLLSKEPETLEYMQMLAEAYRGIKNYDASFDILDNMIELQTENPWPFLFAAETMLEQNKIADAAPYLEKVVRKVPANDRLYEFWVRSLFESKNIEGMLEALEFWLEQEPELLAPYFMYIDYQFRLKNNEEAINTVAKIKDRWQEDSRISYFQGLAAMVENNVESVWFYFKRADGFPDVSSDLYLHYGIWFWEQGYLGDAESICDRAIEKKGASIQFLHMKAMINAQLGNYLVAEDLLETILSVDSTNVNIMEDLANVYVDLNKGEKSIELYEKLLAQFPKNPSVLNNYAYILSRLDRDLDKAMKMVKKALKKEKTPAFCDTKAWIFYRQKKYKKALNWINKALDYKDAGVEVLFHKAKILEAMGRIDDAQAAYHRSLEIEPSFQEAINALEEIK
ncbi:MAG: tetratricopeptide repeat protein [Candidatus Neomarinimicrobiota bacterium]